MRAEVCATWLVGSTPGGNDGKTLSVHQLLELSDGASSAMTIGRLEDVRRRPLFTMPRAIAGMSIRPGIFMASPVSCRLTPTAATTSCTIHRARGDRSPLRSVGRMLAGSSSSSRILRPMPGAARRRRLSPLSRSKQSNESTRSSISNVASTAKTPHSVCGCAGN